MRFVKKSKFSSSIKTHGIHGLIILTSSSVDDIRITDSGVDSEQTSVTTTTSEVNVSQQQASNYMVNEEEDTSQDDISVNSRDEIEREKVRNMKYYFEQEIRLRQRNGSNSGSRSRPGSVIIPDVFTKDDSAIPTTYNSFFKPSVSKSIGYSKNMSASTPNLNYYSEKAFDEKETFKNQYDDSDKINFEKDRRKSVSSESGSSTTIGEDSGEINIIHYAESQLGKSSHINY